MVFISLVIGYHTACGQDSDFTCNEIGVYLTNRTVTINLPDHSKESIRQKIFSFIEAHNYVYKPFYSTENVISFRHFAKLCDKSICGSDLIAKTIFHLSFDSGFIKVSIDTEIYSSFYGGNLMINDNDDVASEKDVPFAPYEFQVPEGYANEYPESIFVFNKKGKTKVKNPEVQTVILKFYNQYLNDLKFYFNN